MNPDARELPKRKHTTEKLLTIFIMKLLKVISEGETESKVKKYLQECRRCVLQREFFGCQC